MEHTVVTLVVLAEICYQNPIFTIYCNLFRYRIQLLLVQC